MCVTSSGNSPCFELEAFDRASGSGCCDMAVGLTGDNANILEKIWNQASPWAAMACLKYSH